MDPSLDANVQRGAAPNRGQHLANTMTSGGEDISPQQSMILARMPQQPALLGSIDDWTGVTNAGDRRKIQNRLNQRLYSEWS